MLLINYSCTEIFTNNYIIDISFLYSGDRKCIQQIKSKCIHANERARRTDEQIVYICIKL